MTKRKSSFIGKSTRKSPRLNKSQDSDEVEGVSLNSNKDRHVKANICYEVDSGSNETASEFVETKKNNNRSNRRVTKVSFNINLKEGSSKKKTVKKPVKKGKEANKKEKRQKILTNVLATRQTPLNLVAILEELSSTQKKQLKEIGFASMVNFKIKKLPMKLALLLVDRLDALKCEMMVEGKLMKITKKDVHDILGFPMGHLNVKDVSRAGMGKNLLSLTWKDRYLPVEKIYLKHVKEMIENQREGGWNYKVDILLAITTVMCEGITCATINQKILDSIDEEDDIKNLDWCGYVIKCLKRSKKNWVKGDRNKMYTGPLVFLVIWYAQQISKRRKDSPAILHWTSKELSIIEANELSSRKNTKHAKVIVPLSVDYSGSDQFSGEKVPNFESNNTSNDNGEDPDNGDDKDDEEDEDNVDDGDDVDVEDYGSKFKIKEDCQKVKDIRVKRLVFGTAIHNAFGDICEWNKELISTIRWGLKEFNGDTEVLNDIAHVKKKWLKKLEKQKKELEAFDIFRTDEPEMCDNDHDMAVDLDEDSIEINPTKYEKNEKNVDIEDMNNDHVDSVEVNGDEQHINLQDADQDKVINENENVDNGNFQMINCFEDDQLSTSLTDSQMAKISEYFSQEMKKRKFEEVSVNYSQSISQMFEDEDICQKIENDSFEMVRIRQEVNFDVSEDALLPDYQGKDLREMTFSFSDEVNEFFQKLPFLLIERHLQFQKSSRLSMENLLDMCLGLQLNVNGSERKETLVIDTTGASTRPLLIKWKDCLEGDAVENDVSTLMETKLQFCANKETSTTCSSVAQRVLKKLQLPHKRVSDDVISGNEILTGKGKREKKLSDAMKSPWLNRVVDIKTETTMEEQRLSNAFFVSNAHSKEYEIVFLRNSLSVDRFVFESLIPGSMVHYGVIDSWSCYLNYVEEFKSKESITRIFFPTNIMGNPRLSTQEKYPENFKRFKQNMELQLSTIKQKITDPCLLFFPICDNSHYYLVCYNLKTNKCFVIDNIEAGDESIDEYYDVLTYLGELLVDFLTFKKHPNMKTIPFENTVRVKMMWRTLKNGIDCGIFLMRHMEVFMGNGLTGFKCGFKKEGEAQQKQLNCLRITYLNIILLSEINTLRQKVVEEIERYESLPEETKKELKIDALKHIEKRIEGRKDL